ncbi:MAG: YwqG family protein [Maledivibacter sp.]|jgi:uncharacterized protein YwqG|nr:YwqG family protein [Maledivibacter sp.]
MLLLLFIFTGCTDKEELNKNQANVSPSSFIEGNKESINMKYELCKQDNYEIIRFSADKKKYKPKFLKGGSGDHQYIDYDEINIPIGKSRVGGPVVDLPEDIEYPEDMYFAAQFNLQEFSKYDKNDLLPDTGFLYIFVDDSLEGKVVYSNCDINQLRRVIKEHSGQFSEGCLIEHFDMDIENIKDKYDEEWARDGEELGWNCFEGFDKSKFFGLYNNCQLGEAEMLEIINGTKVLLVQIGENFTGEGILSVLIEEEDLNKKEFENCVVEWSQS